MRPPWLRLRWRRPCLLPAREEERRRHQPGAGSRAAEPPSDALSWSSRLLWSEQLSPSMRPPAAISWLMTGPAANVWMFTHIRIIQRHPRQGPAIRAQTVLLDVCQPCTHSMRCILPHDTAPHSPLTCPPPPLHPRPLTQAVLLDGCQARAHSLCRCRLTVQPLHAPPLAPLTPSPRQCCSTAASHAFTACAAAAWVYTSLRGRSLLSNRASASSNRLCSGLSPSPAPDPVRSGSGPDLRYSREGGFLRGGGFQLPSAKIPQP